MEKPLETLLAAGASPILCFELMAMTRVAIDTIDASHTNLVKLVGGCIDSQFVFEDVLVASGVDGKPLWDEIAQKNFEKAAGPHDPVTNEQLKPPGWTPPDIEGLLRKQGWTP